MLLTNTFYSLISGIIQGITEFLPISSSGHLILFQKYFGITIDDSQILFDIILHLGTLLAIVIFLHKEIKLFIQDKQNVFFVAVSFAVTAILGLALSKFKAVFVDINFVASMLLINAVILLFAYFASLKNNTNRINLKIAILIGLMQGFAVIPGISRSGATIGIALILGIAKKEAFAYSFILVIPTIVCAFLYQLVSSFEFISCPGLISVLIGFVSSCVFGFLSLIVLKNILFKSRLYYFAIYCIIIGIGILV